MKRWALLILVLIPLIGHAESMPIQGVNLLQGDGTSLGQEATRESLKNLKRLGANTVAFVIFLRQSAVDANRMEPAGEVAPEALRRAIQWAKALELMVVIKPQFLIEESWAGGVIPDNWDLWFESYGGHLETLARLAEEEAAEILIIGTELRLAACQPQWPDLIRRLRTVYTGTLSYAAHGIQGLRAFAFWDYLDLAAITLYPQLGENLDQAAEQIETSLEQLEFFARELPIPLLVAEVGIASRRLATRRPWAWRDLAEEEQAVDLELQRRVLDLWLQALSVDWLEGVLIWSWSTNPLAGGAQDNGFTPQNKPAQQVLACHWRGECG